jgi:hypothetical protein
VYAVADGALIWLAISRNVMNRGGMVKSMGEPGHAPRASTARQDVLEGAHFLACVFEQGLELE